MRAQCEHNASTMRAQCEHNVNTMSTHGKNHVFSADDKMANISLYVHTFIAKNLSRYRSQSSLKCVLCDLLKENVIFVILKIGGSTFYPWLLDPIILPVLVLYI